MKAQYDRLWHMREVLMQDTLNFRSRLDRQALGEVVRGEMTPTAPVLFSYNLGSVARDLLLASASGRYLFRRRIFDLFRKEWFTGWRSYPVALIGKDGERIYGYDGLQITGRAAERDPSRGVPIPDVRGRLVQTRGLFFQNDEWDGSDLFLSGSRVCVTERVRAAMESIRVDNIKFVRLDEVRIITIPRKAGDTQHD
jgi:hypothetical protein